MRKRVFVSAVLLCGACGVARAQTTEAPALAPPGTVAVPAAEREAARRPEGPAAARPYNPDTPGDDKINGLEVPRMKDPREGGREQ